MEALIVVLYQNDPNAASILAVSLSQHFEAVHIAETCQEVSSAVSQHSAGAVVLDLETSGPDEVHSLHRDFPNLCIIGTHRLADDKLWTEALNLGASDICEPRTDDIVRSVMHHALHHEAA